MLIADLFKSRCRLEAENLLLRHQLAIALRRAPPRFRLLGSDRALLAWMTRLWPTLLDAVQVVQPETILRWHRARFRVSFPKIPSGLNLSHRAERGQNSAPIYMKQTRRSFARSLLCALGFPVRPQIFPALAAREFGSQPIEFPSESRGALAISSPKAANFPVSSRETGKCEAETGSPMTAFTANFSSMGVSGSVALQTRCKRFAAVRLVPILLI
ncbi:MAG: hypothetical protein WBE01_03375 [Methyloceanibacter sp.]